MFSYSPRASIRLSTPSQTILILQPAAHCDSRGHTTLEWALGFYAAVEVFHCIFAFEIRKCFLLSLCLILLQIYAPIQHHRQKKIELPIRTGQLQESRTELPVVF
jgi:hypothetical protein